MLERDIKDHLVKRCKALGVYHRKFESPGHNGVPDWILIHNSKVFFVELKRPKAKPSTIQKIEHLALAKAGANIFCIDSIEGLDGILADLMR